MKKKRFKHFGIGKWRVILPLFLAFLIFQTNYCYGNVQTKVNLEISDLPLTDVLSLIQKEVGVKFFYDKELLEDVIIKNLNAKQKDLDLVLDEIIKQNGLEYRKVGESVLIRKSGSLQQQDDNITITGTIVDVDNNPLPGVTVRINKTSIATVTNNLGVYKLNIPKIEDLSLVFSFIGMKTIEVKYKGENTIDIMMEDDISLLEDVIVTGFQSIPKHLMTGAADVIDFERISVPGINTIDAMLEGHVPGMVFMQNSGQVGATPRVRIRGTSTILGNQEPLWVVDDVIINDPVNVDPQQLNDLDFVNLLGNAIAGLNPSEVETITVLKDANATALYGVRAANGVIVVTTKKGKVGPPMLSYSLNGTFRTRPRYTDRGVYMMNSKERVELSQEMLEKGIKYSDTELEGYIGYESAYMKYYKQGVINYEEFTRLADYYQKINTDWFDILLKDVFSQNHNLSVNGGSQSSRYYVSLGYTNDNGNIKRENNDRYTGSMRLSTQYNNLQVNYSMNASVIKKSYTPTSIGVMNYAYNTSRAIPLYDDNGNYWKYYKRTGVGYNIMEEIENSRYTIDQKSLSASIQLQYRLGSFIFRPQVSYSMSYTDQLNWYGEETEKVQGLRSGSKNECPIGGVLEKDNSKNRSYSGRLQIDFNKLVDQNQYHMVNVSAGFEASSNKYYTTTEETRGFLKERGDSYVKFSDSDITKYQDFAKWLLTNTPSINYHKTNLVSGYLTMSYSYRNRYVFNLSTRADFSNAFGDRSNEKLFPVWSFGGRWNIKDHLFSHSTLINDLSWNMSYGIQGNMLNNQPIRMIITKDTYDTQWDNFTSKVKYFPNPDLKWEKTYSFNTGLDFVLLKNSIRGTVRYFYKKTVNAFFTKEVSGINGVTNYTVNKGNVENQGYEFSLNVTFFNNFGATSGGKRGFTWRFDPQLGQILNKFLNQGIRSNNPLQKDDYQIEELLNGTTQVSGVALNTFYSYKFKGLNRNGYPEFYDLEQSREAELDAKYANMTKQQIFFEVLEKSGKRVPELQGGINNYLSYRNFSLSLNLAYSLGSKIRLLRLAADQYGVMHVKPTQNVRKEFVNRWRNPGDEEITNVPRIPLSETPITAWFSSVIKDWDPLTPGKKEIYKMYDDSNIRVASGNYLKIQSARLNYIVNQDVLKRFGLSGLTLTLAGTNLHTFCSKKLKGQSPDQFGASTIINLTVRPTYTLGVSINL